MEIINLGRTNYLARENNVGSRVQWLCPTPIGLFKCSMHIKEHDIT